MKELDMSILKKMLAALMTLAASAPALAQQDRPITLVS